MHFSRGPPWHSYRTPIKCTSLGGRHVHPRGDQMHFSRGLLVTDINKRGKGVASALVAVAEHRVAGDRPRAIGVIGLGL